MKRMVAAAVLGGTVSSLTGGKFASGALTGAFSRAFNDEKHWREIRNQYYRGSGHHFVPAGSISGINLSDEAFAVFGSETNGVPITDRSVHAGNLEHVEYNRAVRAELMKWADDRGIDTGRMTTEQAKSFVAHIKSSVNPSIAPLVGRVGEYTRKFNARPLATRVFIRSFVWLGFYSTAQDLISIERACQIDSSFEGC